MVSHTVTDARWIRHVLMALALTVGAWDSVPAQDAGAPGAGRLGAPKAADPTQQAVDRAVAIYERGEFGRAERAFGGLVARGVPAAAYNLGVMHLRGEAAQPDPQAGLRHVGEVGHRQHGHLVAGANGLLHHGAPGAGTGAKRTATGQERGRHNKRNKQAGFHDGSPVKKGFVLDTQLPHAVAGGAGTQVEVDAQLVAPGHRALGAQS